MQCPALQFLAIYLSYQSTYLRRQQTESFSLQFCKSHHTRGHIHQRIWRYYKGAHFSSLTRQERTLCCSYLQECTLYCDILQECTLCYSILQERMLCHISRETHITGAHTSATSNLKIIFTFLELLFFSQLLYFTIFFSFTNKISLF